jgi:hypothetical protein
MLMPQTFQQVLATELNDRNITQADRAHLERWVNEGHRHDAIWRRLKVAAETRGMLPRGSTYLSIVKEALFMRQCAQRAQSGIDFDLSDNFGRAVHAGHQQTQLSGRFHCLVQTTQSVHAFAATGTA